jgi:hypothetical protein
LNRYGKLKLVLHKDGYAVESNSRELLETLLADDTINACIVEDMTGGKGLKIAYFAEPAIRHHYINDSALAVPSFPIEFDPAAVSTGLDQSSSVSICIPYSPNCLVTARDNRRHW